MKNSPCVTYSDIGGAIIKFHRLNIGLCQKRASEFFGVSQSAFSRIESGFTTITLDQIMKAELVFRINRGEFFRCFNNTLDLCARDGLNCAYENERDKIGRKIGRLLLWEKVVEAKVMK